MKKISLYIIAGLSLFSCIDDDVSDLVDTSEPNVSAPVAVDDEIFVVLNTPLKIENLLDNDTITSYGRISSIDFGEDGKGSMEPQGNGGYKYIPEEGFIGETSFTYELCDENFPANCTTATVKVVVTEAFLEFKANDDFVAVDVNQSLLIDTLLANDIMAENAVIESIDVSNTIGTVSLEGNNIQYVPVNDFSGEDTLVYSVCNTTEDGVEQCDTATVRIVVANKINFTIDSEVSAYYSQVLFFNNGDFLFDNLSSLVDDSHVIELIYTPGVWETLQISDLDPENSSNVLLLYGYDDTDMDENNDRSRTAENIDSGGTGTTEFWNREHVFSRSLGNPNLDFVGPGSDAHNLRPVDPATNSTRSNRKFAAGSGNSGITDGGFWYPGDEWIGDVARMMMYMYLRYGEQCLPTAIGEGNILATDPNMIDLFLQWNIEDPVSEFEIQRNNAIEDAQGNRNPFIDNPFLATSIWGGDAAENTWE